MPLEFNQVFWPAATSATMKSIWPLRDPGTDWEMVLVWRRGGYLSHAAQAWLCLLYTSDAADE